MTPVRNMTQLRNIKSSIKSTSPKNLRTCREISKIVQIILLDRMEGTFSIYVFISRVF